MMVGLMLSVTTQAGGGIFKHKAKTVTTQGISSLGIHFCSSLDCPQIRVVTTGECNGEQMEWNMGVCVCEPGYVFRDNECQACPPGQFSDGMHECNDCPAGTYAETGHTDCTPCPEGTYSPIGGLDRCLNCPAHATCNGTDFTCTSPWVKNTDETGCICPAGYEEKNGTCVVCEVGSSCGCPSDKPLWDGEACVFCPQYRLAKSTPKIGGDPVTDYPGCYCPETVPYYVLVGDKGCYYSEWCHTNDDCKPGYFCAILGANAADTNWCSRMDNGDPISGICYQASALRIYNSNYYTLDVEKSKTRFGKSFSTTTGMNTDGALNFCTVIGKQHVSVLDFCSETEKNLIEEYITSMQSSCYKCVEWGKFYEQHILPSGRVGDFIFSEQLSYPCRQYQSAYRDEVCIVRNRGASPSAIPLCK